MNTLYEQINEYCSMGYYPIVSNKKRYIIVSPFKDKDGQWRDSGYLFSIKTASQYIGDESGYPELGWNQKESQGYKIIGFHRPPINITAHIPKQKSELEAAEVEFKRAEDKLYKSRYEGGDNFPTCIELYYQSRKRVEDIKAKENE